MLFYNNEAIASALYNNLCSAMDSKTNSSLCHRRHSYEAVYYASFFRFKNGLFFPFLFVTSFVNFLVGV